MSSIDVDRERRLAESLRANLKRRKTRARAETASSAAAGEADGPVGAAEPGAELDPS